jgi:hypothetical protein
MRRGDKEAAVPQDAVQFREPAELRFLVQVREDRARIDEVDRRGSEVGRRIERRRRETPPLIRREPAHGFRVHIQSSEVFDAGKVREIPGDAAATASEVEPSPVRLVRPATRLENLTDVL